MSTDGAQSTEQYSVRCIGPDGEIKWEDGFETYNQSTNNKEEQ
jgi:hypothetical protein